VTKASSWAITATGRSLRRSRQRVGWPCSSTVTSRSRLAMTWSLSPPASARAASACLVSAPWTPPSWS
jgi:hypothetical protein